MGVCAIGLRKVCNKDSYGRGEYDQKEMCDFKNKWAAVKMKWATFDIKNSMFQHHTICHHMQR